LFETVALYDVACQGACGSKATRLVVVCTEKSTSQKASLIFCETPTNPALEIFDIGSCA